MLVISATFIATCLTALRRFLDLPKGATRATITAKRVKTKSPKTPVSTPHWRASPVSDHPLQVRPQYLSQCWVMDVYSELFDDDLDAVGIALNRAAIAASVGKRRRHAHDDKITGSALYVDSEGCPSGSNR